MLNCQFSTNKDDEDFKMYWCALVNLERFTNLFIFFCRCLLCHAITLISTRGRSERQGLWPKPNCEGLGLIYLPL